MVNPPICPRFLGIASPYILPRTRITSGLKFEIIEVVAPVLADPACVLTGGSYSPFSPCLTDEPSNGIGEEQDNYGAECNRRHDEP